MRWIDAPVGGRTKCLAVGGSSIISIKLSLPTATTNPGGMAHILGQWSPLLGLALDSAASCFAIGGTWSLYMELVRERIDAGSIYRLRSSFGSL